MTDVLPSTRLVIVLAALLAGACASTGPAPVAVPAPAVPAAPAPGVVATALAQQGVPYRWGGSDPAGFDCSGLVQYAFARHGVALPRETADQYGVGRVVDPGALQAGDLVFFQTTSRGPSHVGLALGDGRFVHAPSNGGVVRVEHLATRYWARRVIGARRVDMPDTVASDATPVPAVPVTPARTVPRPTPFPGAR